MPLGDLVQAAPAVLMVRPAAFGWNPETAASNAFQRTGPRPPAEVAAAGRRECDALAEALIRAGVQVLVGEDQPVPARPDAVFPNNWFTTHGDGTVILYPMASPLRRPERRPGLIGSLAAGAGLQVREFLDLSAQEASGGYLEGTGSLVLDRLHGVAYASLSPRTEPGALADFSARTGYRIFSFHAADAGGRPVYHTNVLLALGSRFAVLCAGVVPEPERAALRTALADTGRQVLEITLEQMAGFAGNLLEVRAGHGDPIVVISSRGWSVLDPLQRRALESWGRPLPVPVPTIEAVGGGSVRCMLAELFLPPAVPGP